MMTAVQMSDTIFSFPYAIEHLGVELFIEKSYKEEMRNFFFERYEYDEETNVFHTYHNYQSPPFVSIGFYEMQPEYIIASYNNTYIPGLHTQF